MLKMETGGTWGFMEAPISTGGMPLKLFLPLSGSILLGVGALPIRHILVDLETDVGTKNGVSREGKWRRAPAKLQYC